MTDRKPPERHTSDDELRVLAEKVIPQGPWAYAHRERPDGMHATEVFDGKGETIATIAWFVVPTRFGYTTSRSDNAAYIAACSPDRIVALLRRLAAAEDVVEKARLALDAVCERELAETCDNPSGVSDASRLETAAMVDMDATLRAYDAARNGSE